MHRPTPSVEGLESVLLLFARIKTSWYSRQLVREHIALVIACDGGQLVAFR